MNIIKYLISTAALTVSALCYFTPVQAAEELNAHQLANKQLVSVITLYHNVNLLTEARHTIAKMADKQHARYYYLIVTHEPGSNNSMYISAFLFR